MATFAGINRRLRQRIARVIADRRIRGFYIGRSVNMEARESAHGAHEARCLYETRSLDRAMDIEDTLIKTFIGHPKNNNISDNAGGNVASGLQHVYLALWFA